MRTSLDIDDDVLLAVNDLAGASKKTAGEVLSELARCALAGTKAAEAAISRNGFVVIPANDETVVTVELIDKLLGQGV